MIAVEEPLVGVPPVLCEKEAALVAEKLTRLRDSIELSTLNVLVCVVVPMALDRVWVKSPPSNVKSTTALLAAVVAATALRVLNVVFPSLLDVELVDAPEAVITCEFDREVENVV